MSLVITDVDNSGLVARRMNKIYTIDTQLLLYNINKNILLLTRILKYKQILLHFRYGQKKYFVEIWKLSLHYY